MDIKTDTIDYTRYYQKWHSDTPEHIQGMKSFYQAMLGSLLPLDKNVTVCDVGCGMGFALLALKDLGYSNLEGIDSDSGQVASCQGKRLNVLQVSDSIAYLESKANHYDLLICLDVIEHIPFSHQLSFVRAMTTALKPQGKIICTVPNANSVLASRWRYNDWTHHSSFTEHSLDFLLYNAGLDEIEIQETEFFSPPSWRPLLSRSILRKWLWKNYFHWFLFRTVRTMRRIEMIAELGWEQGKAIPLSLNILATAVKPL